MAFTLYIYQSEYNEIRDFVLKYPNIETGGDLFGLWTSNADPVVQLLIGPGQKCRRTSVSFHQDTEYLANVGRFVNSSYMLCHLGSWHSHHQLSLDQPSAGDRSTVCNHFPAGLERYIMIIVNIKGNNVIVTPYMFVDRGHVCRRGSVQTIPGKTPLKEEACVLQRVQKGAEHSQAQSTNYGDRRGRTPQKTQRSPDHRQRSPSPHKSHQNTNNLNGHYDNQIQWYTTKNGEAKLKNLTEKIKEKLKPAPEIQYERDPNSLDLTIKFHHGAETWMIVFPSSFDKEQAIIKTSSTGKILQSRDIVEDVKKKCMCTSCKGMQSSKSGRRSAWGARADYTRSTSRRRTPVKVLWFNTEEGNATLEAIKQKLESACDNVIATLVKKREFAKLKFRHGGFAWKVKFPENFPTESAQMSVKRKNLLGRVFHRNSRLGLLPTEDISDAILTKLKENCFCRICKPVGRTKPPSTPHHYSNHLTREPSAHIARSTTQPQAMDHAQNRPRTSGATQWYESDRGANEFRKIHTQISTMLLNGASIDMSRDTSTQEVTLKFEHNCKLWRITFPFNYPKSLPEIGSYDNYGVYNPITDHKKQGNNIVAIIRRECTCSNCSRFRR